MQRSFGPSPLVPPAGWLNCRPEVNLQASAGHVDARRLATWRFPDPEVSQMVEEDTTLRYAVTPKRRGNPDPHCSCGELAPE